MKLSHHIPGLTSRNSTSRSPKTAGALCQPNTYTASAMLTTTAESPTISGTGLAAARPRTGRAYDVVAAGGGEPGPFPRAKEEEDTWVPLALRPEP